jgi:arylformamidase
MHPDLYPPQEPLSPLGQRCHVESLRLGAGLKGLEVRLGNNPYQSLALFPAQNPDGRVLAFIHGGGWTNGYKEWMAFMAPALNAARVTFATIGYRLAPEHSFPAGVQDVMAGLVWTFHNIAAHGGDPRRLFIGGHSAGGHYTALLSVRQDWQEQAGLPLDVVRGCLPVSGVFDFGANAGLSIRPRFLGDEGNETAASPISQITGTPPPFLISYGERDFPHLMAQAETMVEALKTAGGKAESLILPDCGHLEASYVTGRANGPWVTKALSWMVKQH